MGGQYWLYLFPMSLHFGWTTAATLVNINGAFVANPNASSKSIAVLGHLSVLVATALGVFVSVDRGSSLWWCYFLGIVCGFRWNEETYADFTIIIVFLSTK